MIRENDYFPELNGFNFEKMNNKSGIYNVRIVHNKNVASNYQWVYTYFDGEKVKHFHSYDLRLLHKKVLDNGMDWIILDEKTAIDSYKYNNKLIEERNKFIHEKDYQVKSQGISGVNFVRRNVNTDKWCYNSNGLVLSEDTLLGLKENVLSNGGFWIVKDNEIYQKNLEKEIVG